ncbi:hypothetical protein J3R82DRAFT_660 [Butyriboletus roseoflavus]|nr:hypothetical protein J3R82DRAFT_660 [Butyriboletus roseoflavus]
MDHTHEHKDLAASTNGRVSGNSWKLPKTATAYGTSPPSRSQSSAGHKTKWHVRMEKTKCEHAVKKLESELKQEKQTAKQQKREITLQRQKASEERRRLEQEKAIVHAAFIL